MSTSLHIVTNKNEKLCYLTESMSAAGLEFEQVNYSDEDILIYLYQRSTRGIEITKEDFGFSVRIPFFANEADYSLFQFATEFLSKALDADVINDDEEPADLNLFFAPFSIKNVLSAEVEILQEQIAKGNDIELPGPIRDLKIGRWLREQLEKFVAPNDFAKELTRRMLMLQYPPEEFATFSNLMRTSEKTGDERYLQVITNERNTVIEKVDEYAIPNPTGRTIYLDPKQLYQFIPEQWMRIDENVILASVLPEPEWQKYCDTIQH